MVVIVAMRVAVCRHSEEVESPHQDGGQDPSHIGNQGGC